MIRSAITVSLVEEARGGPFVYWDVLADGFAAAAQLGFDAIEIFAPGPDAVAESELRSLIAQYELPVAAVGTGAGMVKHKLSLTDADGGKRRAAREFIKQMIQFGSQYQAPAIIGSMQGRWGGNMLRDQTLGILAEALEELGGFAGELGVPLFYEPLNRYETNLLTTIAASVEFLKTLSATNVKLLADLFHMNIEEADIADAIRAGAGHIGHVHFVDSNRQAAGRGHMDYAPIAVALRDIDFDGYASAEAFPIPDSATAARTTIETFQKFFDR